MAHPQSSPRGFFAKQRIDVAGASLTASGTVLVLSGGVKVSDKQQITGNSTGVFWAANSTVGSMPANVTTSIHLGVVNNSTGVALFTNLGGTTNRFITVQATQPTT